MTSKPLITVVTVTFNASKILEQTIKSVTDQSIRGRMEYLLVDGGSKDGTVDLIRSHAAEIDRWISEPDKGIYDAMNKAVSMASGEWIVFMNAGDTFFNKESLESMELDSSPADLVYGDCVQIYPQGFAVTKPAGNFQELPRGMICSHQSLACRKDLLLEFPFELKYSICGDYHFLLRCLKSAKKFQYRAGPIGVVALETYSWRDISKGILQKKRASREVFHNLNTDIWYSIQLFSYGFKHLVKKLLPVKWLKAQK